MEVQWILFEESGKDCDDIFAIIGDGYSATLSWFVEPVVASLLRLFLLLLFPFGFFFFLVILNRMTFVFPVEHRQAIQRISSFVLFCYKYFGGYLEYVMHIC